MLYDLGYFALLIAFILAVYSAAAGVFGAQTKRLQFVESARNAALVVFVLLTLCVLIVIYGLAMLDFNVAYHPSCVYDARFSCPLTPAENRLPIRIEAGERLRPETGQGS